MTILKIKLSLEISRDSSLVSEDVPMSASVVLWLGHRRNSSFHASVPQRWFDLVLRQAERILELGSNPSSVTDW